MLAHGPVGSADDPIGACPAQAANWWGRGAQRGRPAGVRLSARTAANPRWSRGERTQIQGPASSTPWHLVRTGSERGRPARGRFASRRPSTLHRASADQRIPAGAGALTDPVATRTSGRVGSIIDSAELRRLSLLAGRSVWSATRVTASTLLARLTVLNRVPTQVASSFHRKPPGGPTHDNLILSRAGDVHCQFIHDLTGPALPVRSHRARSTAEGPSPTPVRFCLRTGLDASCPGHGWLIVRLAARGRFPAAALTDVPGSS